MEILYIFMLRTETKKYHVMGFWKLNAIQMLNTVLFKFKVSV